MKTFTRSVFSPFHPFIHVMKNLCNHRIKIHTRRERERGTKSLRIFRISTNVIIATISTTTTTLTKGYKVTLYSDCLRATALYTIYRNSPNLGCPKGQCEYGHYTLVFDTCVHRYYDRSVIVRLLKYFCPP